jgi:predicted pyridoxine 5'-phosphate oxidase superfamily flavin-nucleotide-binding protein
MVALTAEMMEIFKATKSFPLATSSKEGDPNVVPVGAVFLMDPETIWIGNQFMKQTIKNLQENPKACLYLWGPETKGCLKLKFKVFVHTSGPDFEKMKEMVKAKRAELVCKALLECKIVGVFNCKSGPGAGDKLL